MNATKKVPIEHTVDLGTDPYVPDGYTVEEHIGGGEVSIEDRDGDLYINNKKVILHLSERQMDGKIIRGHELREELSGKPVLNANVLNYLLNYPKLIPQSWKTNHKEYKHIFFWGTIYRSSSGKLDVLYLYFGGFGWDSDWGRLDGGWDSEELTALLEEAA